MYNNLNHLNPSGYEEIVTVEGPTFDVHHRLETFSLKVRVYAEDGLLFCDVDPVDSNTIRVTHHMGSDYDGEDLLVKVSK